MNIGEFKTHEGLNSFYEKHADRKLTLIKLNNLVNSFDKSGGPYLLVTHYVNILAFTGLSTSREVWLHLILTHKNQFISN